MIRSLLALTFIAVLPVWLKPMPGSSNKEFIKNSRWYWINSSRYRRKRRIEDEEKGVIPNKKKRGRQPLVEKFPEIVDITKEIYTQNGCAAHARRRNDTQICLGTRLTDVAAELVRRVPGLKSISKNTVARLNVPPNKGHVASKRYRSIIDAKVPPKRNDATKNPHEDTHFCRSVINTAMQLVARHPEEAIACSCDNKAKLNVGVLACSRLYKHKRIFMREDQPNYNDHDFPYANAKIIPAGYKLLCEYPRRSRSTESISKKRRTRRSRSVSPLRGDDTVDSRGRRRTKWPRNGPMHLYLYAQRHYTSTSSVHYRHLREILPLWLSDGLRKSRSVFVNVVDGGPDWTSDSMINLLHFGRLWKELGLDVLINLSYAPSDSKMNPIERGWSYISKLLTGVTLPAVLPGETIPPWLQSDLDPELKDKKTDEVFYQANDLCARYFVGRKYGGFLITPHTDNGRGDDEHEVHTHLSHLFERSKGSRIVKAGEFDELKREYQFLMAHCVKRTCYLQFAKCESPGCEHCTTTPVRAKGFMRTLRQLGGSIPPPIRSVIHKGHYANLDELLVESRLQTDWPITMQPSYRHGYLKKCPAGCDVLMTSTPDMNRHFNLMGHQIPKPTMKKHSKPPPKAQQLLS